MMASDINPWAPGFQPQKKRHSFSRQMMEEMMLCMRLGTLDVLLDPSSFRPERSMSTRTAVGASRSRRCQRDCEVSLR